MRFIDLNELTMEEGILSFGGVDHILVEPNGYKWAEFSNKVEELDNKNLEEVFKVKEWLIETIIPTLDHKELTPTEFFATATICQSVFNGGICDLGKKTKPLDQIIKTTRS